MKRKKSLVWLYGSLLLMSVIWLFLRTTVAASCTSVTVAEARALIDSDPFLVVLDVRNESEYDSGHIRNARLIPVSQLRARVNELDKTDPVLVYCDSTGRSSEACQILFDNGFDHVYSMTGGIASWAGEAYPVYVRYSSIQRAIDNATEGDVIRVSAGLYTEHLKVNKSISLMGEDRDTTIVKGSGNGTVFDIVSDGVSISDFTIRDSGCSCNEYYGIYVEEGHRQINVTENRIVHDSIGVYAFSAREVFIVNNSFSTNIVSCMSISNCSNIVVLGNEMTGNLGGVEIESSDGTVISQNAISSSHRGISLVSSNNCTVSGNILSSNSAGMYLRHSSNSSIFQNSFAGNYLHVADYDSDDSVNCWDNGYPSGGNYWSNYTGIDFYSEASQSTNGSDGIGDIPYTINANNTDRYPLMGSFSDFLVTLRYHVQTVCNSTLYGFKYNGTAISFNVSGESETNGFCRVSLPRAMISGDYRIIVNGVTTPHTLLPFSNTTHAYLYFSYAHSAKEVVILPEYPLHLVLMLLIASTMQVVIVLKKKRERSGTRSSGQLGCAFVLEY